MRRESATRRYMIELRRDSYVREQALIEGMANLDADFDEDEDEDVGPAPAEQLMLERSALTAEEQFKLQRRHAAEFMQADTNRTGHLTLEEFCTLVPKNVETDWGPWSGAATERWFSSMRGNSKKRRYVTIGQYFMWSLGAANIARYAAGTRTTAVGFTAVESNDPVFGSLCDRRPCQPSGTRRLVRDQGIHVLDATPRQQ